MACQVVAKNFVCTGELGQKLNTPLVATAIHGRYDPSVFPAIVSYCDEVVTSAQIFGTSKFVLVGCAEEDYGLWVAHLLVWTLYRMTRVDYSMLNFHVRNCVCRISLFFKINLNLFFDDAASGVIEGIVLGGEDGVGGGPQLDPERFPGMAFALRDEASNSRITVALFDSGNGVGTGIKHKFQMELLESFLNGIMYKYTLGSEYRVLDPARMRTRTTVANDEYDHGDLSMLHDAMERHQVEVVAHCCRS